MKLSANDIVLKLLGLLLLAAAVMKGHELLTTPMANADIWSNRYFMIFQVEFELALGIWLLSGLFKRAAWLAALGCFALFCCLTLYKALAGFGSCGCFGNVHVNPWFTLFVIDLPSVLLLAIFRPKLEKEWILHLPHWLEPMPNTVALVVICVLGFSTVVISSPLLVLNKPETVTSTYEVLEPETWIGKELPIWEHIDIGEQLKTGNWLVILYHYDCPDCKVAIKKIVMEKERFQNKYGNIAFIEIPPYGENILLSKNRDLVRGTLSNEKEWFATAPLILVMQDTVVLKVVNS